MRVAHVITRMIVGGAQENTLHNCLDLIADYGDEVLLITGPSEGPEGDLLAQYAQQHGPDSIRVIESLSPRHKFRLPPSGEGRSATTTSLTVIRIDSLRRSIHPLRDWRAAGRLRQVLSQFKPDVVHTHSAKGGLLGRKVAWSMDTKAVIHSVHGAPFHPYQNAAARWFFQCCERWAAGHCHRMISVADAMTELMVDAGVAPPEKFSTIHSGMDVDPFYDANAHRDATRHQLGIGEDEIVVGKIARLFHLKGHDDLVEAAAEVVQRCRRVRFLLVGDGILRESLQHRISELGLDEHFLFVGLVPPSQVPSLIGAMDLLVHTSLREGLARALPQTLIAGKPVVSYDIDGAREVVKDGETGFLVEPREIRQLANRISELALDGDARDRMGGEGRARFTDQFRHQTMTQKIRHLYEQVLQTP